MSFTKDGYDNYKAVEGKSISQTNKIDCKVRDPEDGTSTYVEDSTAWRLSGCHLSEPPVFIHKVPDMSESHMHYYPEHGTTVEYLQENLPEIQESYNTNYDSSANGHTINEIDDMSSNNSQPAGLPPDNVSLISRNSSQTKTEQVKTVTKVIKTREVHHVQPDGTHKPLNYSPYSGTPEFQLPYNYSSPANVSRDYGTYESAARASSPSELPSQVYQSDYGTYRHITSPANAARNFDVYPHADYGYRGEYPSENIVNAPPGANDSPRAMPQVARELEVSDYNHEPLNYEDIDSSGLIPPRMEGYRRTPPSPTESADRFGIYGYAPQPVPATSPGYHQYDASIPQGYLDRRPSFDDHPKNERMQDRSAEESHTNPLYTRMTGYVTGADGDRRHLEIYPTTDLSPEGHVKYRDPGLNEVIEFLKHPNPVTRANAAAYLQHLSYSDDNIKAKTRALGGIPLLIEMLNEDIPEIQKNACGALRNLSYGRQNDENKRTIRNAEGIPTLVRLLRKTSDLQIRELITGILWNLSSCEDLKRPIIDSALSVLVNHVIIPHSGYDRSTSPLDPVKPHDLYFSTVYRNGSGVLRNVSSAGEYARKKLRECEGLIEAVIYLIRCALGKIDIDNKCVENSVSLLRNLSYRLEETENPDYDKVPAERVESRASAPIRAVTENLGCFGGKKKKNTSSLGAEKRRDGIPLTKNPISESEPVSGVALLWKPELCKCYLSLLAECSNSDTLEAAAGALYNLTACYWMPSIEIRASVRKEKGLPVLVELLRMENDRVCCAAATALRNLAIDPRNKDLIGNYALRDLILKLPNGSPSHDAGTSDATYAAVLATLNEVIVKESDFARSLLSLGGVERLNAITEKKGTYSSRVVKFASQLLYNMWQHEELRDAYKKAGWKESHFVAKSLAARSSLSPTEANSTLNRPVSSQGGTKYEDRTLPHRNELNSTAASIPYSRSEELPLSELGHSTEPPPSSQVNRSHMGVFPPGMQTIRSPIEPVYAQVNREKKKGRAADIPVQLLPSDQSDGMPAGDSWV